MKIDLTGKHAVVTGSTAGIGFAIAKGLAASGASVVVNGRTDAKVKLAVEALKKELPSAKVEGVAADLATAEGVAVFVKRVPGADILVNNLGIFEPKPFEDIPDADWMRFFETNVMSGIRMARAYIPGMKAKDWGRFVFISSESGLNIPLEMIHYGMTKTAQIAVARGLAESLAGTGITVNSVLPGPTRSEGVIDFFGKMAKEQGVSHAQMERDLRSTGRRRSSAGSLRSTRLRIWWSMPARRKPRRPRALRCEWKVGCCVVLRKRVGDQTVATRARSAKVATGFCVRPHSRFNNSHAIRAADRIHSA